MTASAQPPRTAHVIRSDAEAIAIAHKLAARFAVEASVRDSERRLPVAELDEFSASGLWGITVPKAYGGAGVSYVTVAEVIKIISAADSSLGQIPQNHLGVLDILVPPPRASAAMGFGDEPKPEGKADNTARQVMRKRLREGQLDDKEIEIDVADAPPQVQIMGPQGMEEMAEQLRGMFSHMGQEKRKTRKLRIAEAMKLLTDEEAAKLVNEEDVRTRAIANAEQNGIVFIDEIDKVATRQESSGSDISRQGVQRDLLPLVEGTSVSTKYGVVKTDHILFIASGAFHLSKPSDLIPELQGRFPIRVELDSLSVQDFEAILTQTHASLVKQYQALLATEGVTLEFAPEGITRLAHIAFEVNERTENIGARRLSTVMERLLDEVSFDAARLSGQTVTVDAAYVDVRLQALSQDEDLSRYIL